LSEMVKNCTNMSVHVFGTMQNLRIVRCKCGLICNISVL